MRADQYQRLQALGEKLIDVALDEADPATWPGHGIPAHRLNRKPLQERYQCKRNAAATMALCMKVYSLTGHIERNGGVGEPPPAAVEDGEASFRDELEAEVTAAEKEAAALLERLQSRTRERRA